MSFDVSQIKGLTADSRAVKPGWLFAALPGVKADGRDFITDAVARGASAILAPEGADVPSNVELITASNPRKVFAHLAADFYARQPEHIVAVTGTNGKTSVVSFAEQLWKKLGQRGESLGTLKGGMTTPDPVSLHAQLAELADAGVTHLAMEASSHGLDQYRLDGVRLEAAGFTNLSHDHLDYHGDMENYLQSKTRLFAELLPESGVAVLNADVPEFPVLEKTCDERGVKIVSYGRAGHDLKLISTRPDGQGQKLELGVLGAHKDVRLPLVGEFQVMNVLCALGLVIACDPNHKERYIEALERLEGVPGRLQCIPGHPKGAVYVDYAHTPDALENVLTALRPHTRGDLVCVLGCGGERDKNKRPVMGAIAAAHAERVIVTDDNPRNEDPSAIRAAIRAAAPNAREIADRREAIKQALSELETGDVLVIAGKGHEQGQIFADRTERFDDAEEAGKAIAYLTNNQKA
ncbi:MAG: UDP-N-acetylmuramoyl-L-alanyl-D-glutamate--2,6-diaminopimelate ligase [Rhodospirillales bacterium]|nr:UDP-N-acetylmuramoyl-L-alanyl-D-glutamate--2,6-diaminopimelate ligase [Rhodospirillales bacterium]